MNILRKKVLKVLPVWLIAILLVGFASAVTFVWISNNIRTYVTVNSYPITITGEFTDSQMLGDPTVSEFDFEVNDFDNAAGYIVVTFTTQGVIELSPGDIEVDMVMILPTDDSAYLRDGYPMNTATNQLTFVFESAADYPVDFAMAGSGIISLYVTYNVAWSTDVRAELRIASTLDEA